MAGVFLIVGLAAASICLWIAFAVRRRRHRRAERDADIAAGFAGPRGVRSPLHDDEDPADRTAIGSTLGMGSRDGHGEMRRLSGANLAYGAVGAVRPPSGLLHTPHAESSGSHEDAYFDPFAGYPYQPPGITAAAANGANPYSVHRAAQEGYSPVPRSTTPPPGAAIAMPTTPMSMSFGHGRDSSGSGSGENSGLRPSMDRSRSHSMGSYEPLLAAAGMGAAVDGAGAAAGERTRFTPPETPTFGGRAPTPPPRSPLRARGLSASGWPGPSRDVSSTSLPGTDEAAVVAATAGLGASARPSVDERLDPRVRMQRSDTDSVGGGLRDDQDYSRPVLGVSVLQFVVIGMHLHSSLQVRNMPDNASVSEYSVNDEP